MKMITFLVFCSGLALIKAKSASKTEPFDGAFIDQQMQLPYNEQLAPPPSSFSTRDLPPFSQTPFPIIQEHIPFNQEPPLQHVNIVKIEHRPQPPPPPPSPPQHPVDIFTTLQFQQPMDGYVPQQFQQPQNGYSPPQFQQPLDGYSPPQFQQSQEGYSPQQFQQPNNFNAPQEFREKKIDSSPQKDENKEESSRQQQTNSESVKDQMKNMDMEIQMPDSTNFKGTSISSKTLNESKVKPKPKKCKKGLAKTIEGVLKIYERYGNNIRNRTG